MKQTESKRYIGKAIDWKLVQKKIDDGYSYRMLTEHFGLCSQTISSANKQGLIKTRSQKEGILLYGKKNIGTKLSETTKKKISEKRKEYLANNPDKVPYRLNHSSKESHPEKLFREALEKANIVGWVQEYKFGVYQFDFAFPEFKIDIEIDGMTHTHPNVIEIDKRRDQIANNDGWKVIRFTATEVKNNVYDCIDRILPMVLRS